jgi:glycerol-3-phosphate acyltransferase PlsY
MVGQEWLTAVLAVAAYLIGSVPFGVVAAKALGAPDPRTGGSRNIGFTNVLRVSGTTAGALTLIGDAGKGWLAGWVAQQVFAGEAPVLVVAGSVILGHLHSVFLGFRGGKGVATAIGAILAVAFPVGAVLLCVWLMTVAVTRISSAGAVVGFLTLPLVGFLLGGSRPLLVFLLGVSAIILWRHQDNIERLWRGHEPRMGQTR